LKSVKRLVREAISLYWESGIADDVPALAWFLLSSLAPLALGITALATVLLGDYRQAQAVADRIAKVLPHDVHDQVVDLVLRTKHDSPLLLVGSIVAMLWVASGAVGVVSRVLRRLLELPNSGIVTGKLRNLAVAGAMSILVVLMVIAASAGSGLVHRVGLPATLTRIVVPVLTGALTAVICAGVYWSVTSRAISFRSALYGGLVAAVILLVTPTAAGYYLRYVAGSTPAELFLMLAGVLFTCYLAAFGLLLGAGVTARSYHAPSG
jgi:uncharacterized BrkB/YihY/UPF0761 family membrane protein